MNIYLYVYYEYVHLIQLCSTILATVGSTSVIGKDFADYLCSCGMNLLLISKSESQLAEQGEVLRGRYPTAQIKIVAHDFSSHKVRQAIMYVLTFLLCVCVHTVYLLTVTFLYTYIYVYM